MVTTSLFGKSESEVIRPLRIINKEINSDSVVLDYNTCPYCQLWKMGELSPNNPRLDDP